MRSPPGCGLRAAGCGLGLGLGLGLCTDLAIDARETQEKTGVGHALAGVRPLGQTAVL
ncbi:MAG: hypothetical protein JSW67_12920 [Candidatus Latescibacterota bacterium]|nr:MAG: hypothetical protein JSW67_12920 [Candidatus Latescibacterota bacterium]